MAQETTRYISSFIKKDFLDRLFVLLLILVPASLPYHLRVSSMLAVLLALVWLLQGGYKNILNSLKNPYVVLFISLFFIPLISILFSANKDFSLVEKRAGLLLFPIMLSGTTLTRKSVWLILWGFALSCSVGAMYSFAHTLKKHEPFNTEMTLHALGTTHVYFGLFLSFTVIILGYFLITRINHDYISLLVLNQIAFLLFFMFILGGKMSIISLFILSLIASMAYIVTSKRWVIGGSFLLVPLIIFLITVFNIEDAKTRFTNLFNPDHYFVGDNAWNSIGVRLTIFKCTSEIYSNNPVTGTGVGDVQKDLDKCYENSGFPTVKLMNAHNQYLQILLGTGVIGLICFLITLFYPASKNFRGINRLYLSFIFLFGFCCLTESLLERQQGVMFFSFFNSLLFFQFGKTRIQE